MIVDQQSVVTLNYRNHKDELHTYKIVPTGRMVRGPNQWHPDAPWLIEAEVLERDGTRLAHLSEGLRTFDPAKIQGWYTEVEPDPVRRAAYLLLYHGLKAASNAEAFRETMRGWLSELHKALDSTR